MTAETRATEMSKLVSFFKYLADRASRGSSATKVNVGPERIPNDITPVVANIVNTRNGLLAKKDNAKLRTGRSISPTSTELSDDDSESVAEFPLGKQYNFTFRHMLHKLYQRDDWLKKVQEALEQSQQEYKPLAERLEEMERERESKEKSKEKENKEIGEAHRALKDQVGGKRGTVRPRSFSVASVATDPLKVALPILGDNDQNQGEIRALKRRCVGRRISMNGPLEKEGNETGGGWAFDARISQSEDRSIWDTQDLKRARRQTLGGSTVPTSAVCSFGNNEEAEIDREPNTGRTFVRKRTLTAVSTRALSQSKSTGLKRPLIT
ncbi:hypothetical protein FA15DRAFT_640012 [Coprinopsis marcescibilis]|uniref:Uncharacterized protein n=1 Tax=Coprinopsis marcescibilis TaxID=230819 RepID=A0A5C3KZ36_COPMA|nr:hypothetical protein FA15DRAFT_640012 [Coprinopsis marcescibilis]